MQQSTRPPRVLVVEDEPIIAMELADILELNGCRVSDTVGDIETARDVAASGAFDVALLDVSLGGRSVEPVADVLARRGIPYGLVTAYSRHILPQDLQWRPRITKPFTASEVMDLVTDLLVRDGEQVH
jgi:DNA-binding response OmpR family regulator